MPLQKTLRRELQVAFSKDSQPIWFRITKYIVLGIIIYFFKNTGWLCLILSVLLVLALMLHFWYRYKTDGWRKTYGMWKYDGKGE